MTNNITTFNDTLVQLEKLHTAYSTILEQAKEQLENLELTESTKAELVTSMKRDMGLMDTVAYKVFELIRQDLVEKPEQDPCHTTQYFYKRLISDVADKVIETIKKEIEQEIGPIVNTALNSATIERALERKVKQNDAIQSALVIQQNLAQIFDATKS